MFLHYTTKIRDARLVGFPPPLEESGDIFFK
jgi:hypothetical protein